MSKTSTKPLWSKTFQCESAEVLAATVNKELEEFGKLANLLAEPDKTGLAALFSDKSPYKLSMGVIASKGKDDAIKYTLISSATK